MGKFLPSLLLVTPTLVYSLATSGDAAELAKARLMQSFSSPAGKLTIAPELVIPEPSDPTAILLQSNAVGTLSERIRQCKANSAWISGGLGSLQTFCTEQENALGAFPGPLPVVYCGNEEVDSSELSRVGVSGVMVSVLQGRSLVSLEELDADDEWAERCRGVLGHGLQPIPEVTLTVASDDASDGIEIESLVDRVTAIMGAEPAAILVTIDLQADSDEDLTAETQNEMPFPAVPKPLGKRVPILGSVRVPAGESRISSEVGRFRQAGFSGVLVRSDCIPGFRMNPDLEIVGRFWSSCIGELKSTRSKSFNFNSRNNMETNKMAAWASYQQDVIDSGALGDPDDAFSAVNSAAGEYKGFA